MRSDGRTLPDLAQTLVLLQLGLIRTDQLADLAARWLAADMTDRSSTRMLAGHNPSDPWTLHQLLDEAAAETGTTAPTDPASLQATAVDWVTATWRNNHDTRAAIARLARLGETHPDFDLGLFIGLDDEWTAPGDDSNPTSRPPRSKRSTTSSTAPTNRPGATIDAGAKARSLLASKADGKAPHPARP